MQVFGAAEPATGQGQSYKLKNAAAARQLDGAKWAVGMLSGLVAMALLV